jgi:hypothetical protein
VCAYHLLQQSWFRYVAARDGMQPREICWDFNMQNSKCKHRLATKWKKLKGVEAYRGLQPKVVGGIMARRG